MQILTTSEIELFNEQGYLVCKNVFPKTAALAMQKEIWQELEGKFGIQQFDRTTWRVPPQSPKDAKDNPLNEQIINQQFLSIINDLLGKDTWVKPRTWGGFLVTFPTDNPPWKLTHELWHWDYELFRLFELKGLLIFSFYGTVPPQGGGTLVVSGSHRILENFYHTLTSEQKQMKHGAQRKLFMQSHPWFKELSNPKSVLKDRTAYFMNQATEINGVSAKVVELTGEPGDVVFCHPRLIHVSAGINLNNFPRIMRVKFLW